MKHYLVLPKVFLCCVAMSVLSGCVDILVGIATGISEASREVDTRGAWGAKTSKNTQKPILPVKTIKRGKTTKGEVLAMLSIPEEKTSDDRFFLYRYELQIYKVRKKDNIVVERIPEGRLHRARFLIWFDQADIVKRYLWRLCEPTTFLKCYSGYQMCEMIKRLKDEQLIAEYC